MWNQLVGTAMGHIFAPPYACLTIGYLEEDNLFKDELPQRVGAPLIQVIQEHFKRYMDDGTTMLPPSIECDTFLNCLNNLHPAIEYTLEPAIRTVINGESVHILNFLDITVILHDDGTIETDIFYKPTNSHKYLNYESFHPKHCKDNIPYALAKRIIVFVTNPEKMEFRLSQLKSWLKQSGYPEKIIEKGIHNARLQGPSPKPKNSKNTIPFVTTHMSNYDAKSMTNTIRTLISATKSDRLREIFNEVEIVVGNKQPQNLRGLLTKAKFGDRYQNPKNLLQPGIFAECTDPRCKICSLGYIQTCSSFETSNGTIWQIKSHINCNTKKVLYYLKCNMCNGATTYTGLTKTKLRARTNNHITCCRKGTGSDIFDRHVFKCGTKNKCLNEPFFKMYAFMAVSAEEKLITYERYLHRGGHDTMNN